MSADAAKPANDAAADGAAPKKKGKKKLILLAVPLLLGGAGAGLWFTGVLPGLLGMDHKEPDPKVLAEAAPPPVEPPTFFDMPEIITNLNGNTKRPSFVKLKAKFELGSPKDAEAMTAALPRLVDLLQTYLREMRPEELRGSEGTHRLREELIARAGIAASPAHVTDVLFAEMLIQ